MKVSILVPDNKVYVDGVALGVGMNDMPSYVHAVQWYGAYGEVEFAVDKEGRKLPNLRFTDITPFDFMVDRWKQTKKREDQKKQREEEEKMANLAKSKAEEVRRREERPM